AGEARLRRGDRHGAGRPDADHRPAPEPFRRGACLMSRAAVALRALVLGIGAVLFLFPFYYMVIGSLQLEPDQSVAGAFPHPGNLTGANYAAIDSRIGLLQGLVNSGIFTGG